MPKLSAIQQPQDTRELELNFGEDENGEPIIVKMTILPDKFTLGRQRQIAKASKSNDMAGLADVVFSVVQSWDVEDDEGNVLPLNQAGIDHLKWETALAITRKMNEALSVPKSETTSG